MEKYHIEKNSVQETLMIPLLGRKLCTEAFPELYKDDAAVKLCAAGGAFQVVVAVIEIGIGIILILFDFQNRGVGKRIAVSSAADFAHRLL